MTMIGAAAAADRLDDSILNCSCCGTVITNNCSAVRTGYISTHIGCRTVGRTVDRYGSGNVFSSSSSSRPRRVDSL